MYKETSQTESKQRLKDISTTKFYGDRSFAFAAANLWNKLPSQVRHAPSLGVFKSKLKTPVPETFLCELIVYLFTFY